jgi:hypothetical protein
MLVLFYKIISFEQYILVLLFLRIA